MKAKRLYRKATRKACRYILGFERCPTDYKRNYKEETLVVIDAFIITAATVFVFFMMIVWAG